jgi:hypothetical protein
LCRVLEVFPGLTGDFMHCLLEASAESFELLRAALKAAHSQGELRVVESEFEQLLLFVQDRLDDPWAGDCLCLLLEMAPEAFALDDFLTATLEHIEALGQAGANAPIGVLCSAVYGIALHLKGAITNRVPEVVAVLVKCLDLQAPALYEEAVLALSMVIAFAKPDELSIVPDVVRHIVAAQVSQSPNIIAFGAALVVRAAETFGVALQGNFTTIVDCLTANLDEESLPVLTVSQVVTAIAAMVEFVGVVAVPFCQVFLGRLTRHVDWAEADAGLCTALLGGFRAVLVALRDDEGLRSIDWKVVFGRGGLMEKVGRWDGVDVKMFESVGRLLTVILEVWPKGGPLKALLNRACVKVVLDRAASFVQECRTLRTQLEKV